MYSYYTLSMMDDKKSQSIAELLAKIAATKQELEGRLSIYDGKQQLKPAEVSLLISIADHPHESVTYIASALLITKGAVSQTLKKLELKELVVKLQDPSNASKISISLSFKGRIIVKKLQDRQKRIDDVLENHIAELKKKDFDIIQNFLIQYEESLGKRK